MRPGICREVDNALKNVWLSTWSKQEELEKEEITGSLKEIRKWILLIDDNESLGCLLRRKLKGYGYGVISVADELSMVRRAFKEAPDLILLDMELSLGNGATIYKNLKKSRKEILIPILPMSFRLSPKKLKKKAARLGAKDWIAKPFELEDLVSKIKKSLGERQRGR